MMSINSLEHREVVFMKSNQLDLPPSWFDGTEPQNLPLLIEVRRESCKLITFGMIPNRLSLKYVHLLKFYKYFKTDKIIDT